MESAKIGYSKEKKLGTNELFKKPTSRQGVEMAEKFSAGLKGLSDDGREDSSLNNLTWILPGVDAASVGPSKDRTVSKLKISDEEQKKLDKENSGPYLVANSAPENNLILGLIQDASPTSATEDIEDNECKRGDYPVRSDDVSLDLAKDGLQKTLKIPNAKLKQNFLDRAQEIFGKLNAMGAAEKIEKKSLLLDSGHGLSFDRGAKPISQLNTESYLSVGLDLSDSKRGGGASRSTDACGASPSTVDFPQDDVGYIFVSEPKSGQSLSDDFLAQMNKYIGSLAINGGGSIQVVANPESLGLIKLSVSVLDGVVSLAVETESEDASDSLSDNLSELSDSFAGTGLLFDEDSVEFSVLDGKAKGALRARMGRA